ncbi:unnamed protein product [Acanthoscelides obtectus]|uniref:Uncharacterized protein n=1 Tax=Acanthoscelides obtectus TaxID=200917 RepID=A0A9P0L2P7_ACAOB|nr:unnamed protein product [Acanthoscelides obtectus]CAK1661182.1 hypothetical protein AOBTE_LOCUS22498 [Acanthoscelides obtectus]
MIFLELYLSDAPFLSKKCLTCKIIIREILHMDLNKGMHYLGEPK